MSAWRSTTTSTLAASAVFPNAAQLPELETTPARPSLVTVIADFIETDTAVFRCPGDDASFRDAMLAGRTPPQPAQSLTFYEKDGLSYEYQWTTMALKSRQQILRDKGGQTANLKSSATVFMANDYDSFHGPPSQDGSRCYLYMDGHADAIYNVTTTTSSP